MPLTRKQRKLKTEIEAISALAGLDHWDIENYLCEFRTVKLELIKHHLVRGRVIMVYTKMDDLLAQIICNSFFGMCENALRNRQWTI
jgi:hypothetical protein